MSLNSLADLGREKEKILPLLVNWFNQKGESKEHVSVYFCTIYYIGGYCNVFMKGHTYYNT